ncbi:ribosome maturation factor RimM [Clostridium thermarum]|uniref:ribosome maturation factor RimM n=1 Tax=Clostridium thermarum TaxID=1716543 RepID=UPI0013CFE407|nr:ribosome maturation factor RimM [Clostridium thermarum]
MKDELTIGQIINTHGVKGELKVHPLTDDIKRFKKLKYVLLDGEEKKVIWVKLQNDKAILKLEGIETMDEAEKLKNKYIKVKRKDAAKLPEGRYFVVDIIGCKVSDTNGKYIGEVKEVIFTGSNDVYWVKGEKDVLVPVIESVVKEIDIENASIIIEPVEVWNYED